jgi:hypothetical protein
LRDRFCGADHFREFGKESGCILLQRIRSTLAAQMFLVMWSEPSANKAQIKGKPAKVIEKIVEEKVDKLRHGLPAGASFR